MICEIDPGAGPEDQGNLFNVRSDDGGKTLVWNIDALEVGRQRKRLNVHSELVQSDALNLFAWGVAVSGVDLVSFVRRVENISGKEILTSDEKAFVSYALGALQGDYIKRAREKEITAEKAAENGKMLVNINFKLSQL